MCKCSMMHLQSVLKTTINVVSAKRLTITPEYLPLWADTFMSIGISLSTKRIVWGLFW